jgi:type II secretion system protein D
VPAQTLRTTLIRLLGERGDVQVVASDQPNQILVQGPADAQSLARQLVAALDRPQPDAGTGSPTVRTYRCGVANPQQVAERLRASLPGELPVRLTVDTRSGSIVVVAPPEIQATIPALLATIAGPGGDHPARAGTLTSDMVKLSNARADRVLARLQEMFAGRLVQTPAPGPLPVWTLTTAASDAVQLECDVQANQITIYGRAPLVRQTKRLIEVLDSRPPDPGRSIRIVPLRKSSPAKVEEAADAYRGGPLPERPAASHPTRDQSRSDQSGAVVPAAAYASSREGGPLVRALFQPQRPRNDHGIAKLAQAEAQPPAAAAPGTVNPPTAQEQREDLGETQRRQLRELGADVEIETLGDLDVVILRGRERDVNELIRIIEEIERISAETTPQIEVVPLEHAGSAAVGRIVTQIQAELLAGRQGRAIATPLVHPNAILLVGWGEALGALKELIEKLDQPAAPEAQFRVFRLKNAAATAMQATLQDFFREPGATANAPPRVAATADQRTNSIIVQGSPRDLAEVELLLARLDVPSGSAVNVLRVFRLRNMLAADLAPALQAAITGTGPAAAGAAPTATPGTTQRIEALQFFTFDAQGQRLIRSGNLTEVRITPEPRTNTIIVSAPPESIDLIAALVEQLDSQPATTAQVKVFRIVNGDAARLVEMLQALLGVQALLPGGPQLPAAEGEASLAPLRFSVDNRTNSIIASGSPGDLTIVEAILLRLDESDVQERRSTVFRLKNAPAADVAESINEFLRSERRVQEVAPGTFSPFQRIEAEVVVVPEPVSNSLIISATPRYYGEILQLVERLDAQPAQVMIQVLIADVELDNNEEFGVELGIQDSVLFDRSIFTNIFPTSATTYNQILSATQSPGFAFNDPTAGLPNSGGARSLATAGAVGGQGVTNFSLGRVNPDIGFGGLILSASSENVSVLIRALREKRRIDVLSRPQVMTLDNQPAFIQVGQRVPRVALVSLTSLGQVSNIDLINVGLILGVTPRISPDGTVVMEIDAERSELGPEATGIPISVSSTGQVIRSPRIDTTTAQTTVSAADGQTIVLGGLITKSRRVQSRRVPVLSDIPVLGLLFRYDLMIAQRTELLIILTPHVVRSEAEANEVKQAEAARMSWCLGDVEAIQGPTGIHRRGETETDHYDTIVVYPDENPRGMTEPVKSPPALPETLPSPRKDSPIPAGPELPAPGDAMEPRANPQATGSGDRALGPALQPRPTGQGNPADAAMRSPAGAPRQLGPPPDQVGSGALVGRINPQMRLPAPAASQQVRPTRFESPGNTSAASRISPRPDAKAYLPRP